MDFVAAACSACSPACSPGCSASAAAILFVPTLVALGLTQVHAEATSLLAMIPAVLLGVWRQSALRERALAPFVAIGVASIGAAVGGAALAVSLPESVLRRLFAALLLFTAARSPGGRENRNNPRAVPDLEDLWIPLVDEPIGSIVDRILREDAELAAKVETPHRILAFRTFAYIRTGILLGQLLFDSDIPGYDGSENWVEALLREPEHREAIEREVRAVADEIVSSPEYADDGPLAPDDEARSRFRAFARDHLGRRA